MKLSLKSRTSGSAGISADVDGRSVLFKALSIASPGTITTFQRRYETCDAATSYRLSSCTVR